MKFLFASDSFKGTLSSEQIIRLLTESAKEAFPDCETAGTLIADGGEGTGDAVIAMTKGELIRVPVHGPLMEETTAVYGKSMKTVPSSRWLPHRACPWCRRIFGIR